MEIVKSCARSDVGKGRSNNEDFYLLKENLFLVADGVGGEYGGEIASRLACETIAREFFSLPYRKDPPQSLILALKEANRQIVLESRKVSKSMATTICALFIQDDLAYFTHLGDSRIYLVRDKKIKRLTEDHKLVPEHKMSGPETVASPYAHVITRALGSDEAVDVAVKKTFLKEKDLFLLTTDGLTDNLSDDEILESVLTYEDIDLLSEKLVDLANRKGGGDNITVGIVRVEKTSRKHLKRLLVYIPVMLVFLFGTLGYPSRLHKKEIRLFLEDWKKAWENREMDRLRGFYAQNFNAKDDLDIPPRMKKYKTQKNQWIKIDFDEKTIEIKEKIIPRYRVRVSFIQFYQTPDGSEKSQKTLVLKRKDGEWEIVKEIER
ncbi:MAG: protein phosphatase 2C domain-containing protein [Candidatus Omnitrophota bacterium]